MKKTILLLLLLLLVAAASALAQYTPPTPTSVSGNAGSATVLQTARAINGVSFDGSAPITVAAAAGTLTGSSLASGVTSSSLTTFGSGASVTGNAGTATVLQTPRLINGVSFNGSADISIISAAQLYSSSFSGVGTATTSFVVTIGQTMANSTYKVTVEPTNLLAAAVQYVSAKSTTTFTVTYIAGLTGTVTFDWVVVP